MMQLSIIPEIDILEGSPFKIAQQDAIEFLSNLPDASVDCIVTDPAYESLEKHRSRGTTPRLTNWFEIFPNDRFVALFQQLYRVLKNDRHCYVICDQETMFLIKPIGEAAGFKFWKPIVWDKVSIGMGYHYRARCEFILFFEKGKRKLNNLAVPDVLTVQKIKGYPTEKPVELLKILIKQSTQPDEVILDCFMGSGSTGKAALKTDRAFIGCDTSANAFNLTHDRLEGILEYAGT
jgi:site-specific DNA-methyltransferase (adenine-specific)